MIGEETKKEIFEYGMSCLNLGMGIIDKALPNPYNKIYDDFKSRTCENCKHGEYEKNIKAIYCPFVNYLGSDYMEPDFGCNKFERKDI